MDGFILPPLRQQDNEEVEDSQQLSSLDENDLTFSGTSSHLSRGDDDQSCEDSAVDTSTAGTDTNNETLASLPVVGTIGPDNLFQRGNAFSMPGDNTVLAVPPERFQATTTTSCSTTGVGHLVEMHQTVNQQSENHLNPEEPALEKPVEPKKRRGGWPKGKKRKKDCIDLNKPKAPIAGYVRFINSRRPAVKAQHPNLPTTQITKLIGTEWNAMSAAEKQAYNDAAEDDKKRYLEELIAYQQTEAYQAFLKRQQTKKLKDLGVENLEELDPNFLTENYNEGIDSTPLYCKVCNQHFSSEHNKKEHMLGRQHLQMVTEEFEKEAHAILKAKPAITNQLENLEKIQSDNEDASEMSDATKLTTLSDVMETLLQHNYDREIEIRELRKNLADYENQQTVLSKELEQLKKLVFETEESLNASKSFGSTLSNQLDELRVVPCLFGVIL